MPLPESLVLTVGQRAVKEYADQAVSAPGGIRIRFPFSKYKTPKEADSASRSFQITASNLKSRERARLQRNRFNLTGEQNPFLEGPYDSIAIQRRQYEDGWEVILAKVENYLPTLEVTDMEGNPVFHFTPEGRRSQDYFRRIAAEQTNCEREKRPWTLPLNAEEVADFWEIDPETARFAWEQCGLIPPTEGFMAAFGKNNK